MASINHVKFCFAELNYLSFLYKNDSSLSNVFLIILGWKSMDLWLYAQHQHFRNSSSLTASKNLPLIPFRSALCFPHGKHLLQKTSESSLKNTTDSSGIR